ncbi:MAG TPA: HAD family phosphatase [Solirubrobacteraceae bacterium]|nr:HAD family phosphatase [Solirubrobacteraceae bacterium]
MSGPTDDIRIVLFDIGGVLARFRGLEVLRELTGARSELDVAARWLMSPWVRRFESGGCTDEAFAAGIIDEWQFPYTAAEFLELFPGWLDEPFEGAERMVRATSERVGVGCLSNTNALQWRTKISHWAMAECFTHRFLSFELGAVKPDRVIYERVIGRLPAPPDRVLFLDDNPLNVEGARAAGLRAEQTDGVAGARAALARHGVLPDES